MAAPLQASFGPAGGTLGRSPDCTLALPDEGRHISRKQARIDVVGAVSTITGLSAANPLLINGRELRQGESRRLLHGDRIHVAEYELVVEEGTGPSGAIGVVAIPGDPFGDPLSDPFAGPSGPSGPSTAARAFPVSSPASRTPARSIPDEFDPFTAEPSPPLSQPSHRSAPDAARDPLGLNLEESAGAGLPASREDSIDALFGLESAGDPLGAQSPLGRPPGEARAARQKDDFESARGPMPDDASILAGSFRLPQAIPPTEFGIPDDPVLSWKNESDPLQEAMLPPVSALNASPPQRAGTTGAGAPAERHEQLPTNAVVPSSEVPNTEDLLKALLRGLGASELPPAPGQAGAARQLTPELMQRVGELLAAACDGTVTLLQARAMLKQQLRADVTLIGSRDNNPLKFVPDGRSALNQLLAPKPVRGFMEPQRAMRDAYDDLLAHQVGFVAGMRAAMHGLIGRFDPAALEDRLASRSVLDSMLPANRKARLWELFSTLYVEVSREAEDDFERLFGRAFVEAYEEQIARIEAAAVKQSGRPGQTSVDGATKPD